MHKLLDPRHYLPCSLSNATFYTFIENFNCTECKTRKNIPSIHIFYRVFLLFFQLHSLKKKRRSCMKICSLFVIVIEDSGSLLAEDSSTRETRTAAAKLSGKGVLVIGSLVSRCTHVRTHARVPFRNENICSPLSPVSHRAPPFNENPYVERVKSVNTACVVLSLPSFPYFSRRCL